MKILLATYWTVPHLGGVWNYMVQLKENLESLGHEVDLLGYGEDNTFIHKVNKDQRIEKDKLLPLLQAKITPENYPGIYANKLVEYTEFQRYCYELGAVYLGIDQYDIIHTQDVISAACLNRVRPKETPLVATLHGSVAHEIRHQIATIHNTPNAFMARAYYDELEHLGATSAETTIVANNWLKNILTDEFGVAGDQIKVLHYGFDTESFLKRTRIPSKIVLPKDKKVIIYSGRLVPLKGVHDLLFALKDLKEKRDDWVCWIVGDGDSKEEMILQRNKLGLEDQVLFFGSRKDVPYLLANSDIYVLPSLLENQPLSVIEAQLAAKAVIVSDAGGLPEMVEHGVTGIITPAGNPARLSEHLYELLDNGRLRKTLGTNAKNWGLSHWSIKRGVKGLMDVYKDAIAKRKKVLQDEQNPQQS
ncbi:glycosyltransferase [Bacillus lacus]|uniref:Glycosyltransferase n=1 Tax=Metabacillus lacus TaxID=1983721 RepID=A0A7X2J2H4_9BACI|nr:glycosyltransferase family 4 protein [Metabacillus lacus]MRX74252.1 glycosyltransferase [Metabacillus lacus]